MRHLFASDWIFISWLIDKVDFYNEAAGTGALTKPRFNTLAQLQNIKSQDVRWRNHEEIYQVDSTCISQPKLEDFHLSLCKKQSIAFEMVNRGLLIFRLSGKQVSEEEPGKSGVGLACVCVCVCILLILLHFPFLAHGGLISPSLKGTGKLN